mmetsp:Transcript_110367/g.276314  ORF Transcript_110367/g.276314 Transcript_110367/m.276314 type:complete len:334 (-) Transcript_110367:429-1430(-)
MPIKTEIAGNFTGKWKVGMFEAPCQSPLQFCYGACCTCCAVYQQRESLLNLTGEPYICCAGLCPCGPLGQPQDKSCLIVEACCCTGWALSGNRYMIQTRFDRENTPCDDCILWGTCLFVWGLNIARCFVDIPDELDFIADCLVLSANGCMHAQQHIEIEHIKKQGYNGPNPQIVNILPPLQQQMIQQGKPVGNGGARPNMVGAAAGGMAAGGMAAGHHRPQPQTYNRPQPQMMQQQPMQMQQPAIQVQCGGCRQIFGSPGSGLTVACPHCGTHNQIPYQGGMNPGMYGGGGGGGMYAPQQQQRPGPGMGTMAAAGAGVAAGAVGGMVLADMMF